MHPLLTAMPEQNPVLQIAAIGQESAWLTVHVQGALADFSTAIEVKPVDVSVLSRRGELRAESGDAEVRLEVW